MAEVKREAQAPNAILDLGAERGAGLLIREMGTPAALLGLLCKLLTRVILIILRRPLGGHRVKAGLLVLHQQEKGEGWGGVERAEGGQEGPALGWVPLLSQREGTFDQRIRRKSF